MPRYEDYKELFEQGYTPSELVKLGYSKSSVYYAWKRYKKELEEKPIKIEAVFLIRGDNNGIIFSKAITIPRKEPHEIIQYLTRALNGLLGE